MISRRAAGGLVGLLVAVAAVAGLGALPAACSARDLEVSVSDNGVDILSAACAGFFNTCADEQACVDDPIFCTFDAQGACTIRKQCQLDEKGIPHARFAPGKPLSAQLLVISKTEPEKILAKSSCRHLDIAAACATCGDAVDDAGAPLDSASCGSYAIGHLVDTALAGGLGYDGFGDPDAAFLAVAFFQDEGTDGAKENPCDNHVVDRCGEASLVAVAGFAKPLGSSTFDVTCASCQNGLHFSTGSDTGPCPVTTDQCFLEIVGGLLK